MKKEQNKNFEKEIQKILGNHTMPVDSQIWSNIEKCIAKPTSKRVIPIWWWTSGAVAAILIIALLIFPIQKERDFVVSKTEQKIKNKTKQYFLLDNKSVYSSKEEKLEKDFKKTKFKSSLTTKRKILAQNKIRVIEREREEKKEKNSQSSIDKQRTIIINTEQNKTKKKIGKNKNKDISNNKKRIEIENLEDWDKGKRKEVKTEKKGKVRNRLLLTAIFSAEKGNQSQQNSPMNFHRGQFMYKSLTSSHMPIESNSVILATSEYPKHRHLPPVSFGLMVDTKISKNWSLETGLVYTYLRSEYRRSGDIQYIGTQELHYVGIPVNIRYNFLGGKKWNIYMSVGEMAEKGIHSTYTQDIIKSY